MLCWCAMYIWLTFFPEVPRRNQHLPDHGQKGGSCFDRYGKGSVRQTRVGQAPCAPCPIPWLDYLTCRQREAVYMIEHYDQYNELLRTEVDTCMREMPLVSVDTESRIGEEHPFTAQVAFMHSFCVIIFCLDKLWHQGSRTSHRVVDLLPAHLVIHLHHPDTNVLVSGAGESHHFGPIRMVDVQHLFMANRHCFSYADRTVATRHRGKCGLVIVSMVTNNYCHKSMKIQLAQDWFGHFGPHRGRLGWCGYDSWPA